MSQRNANYNFGGILDSNINEKSHGNQRCFIMNVAQNETFQGVILCPLSIGDKHLIILIFIRIVERRDPKKKHVIG